MELRLGQVVVLRRKHPCGSTQWEVVRLGADIGIKCQGCGRRLLLPRHELRRRVKTLPPSEPPSPAEGV